MGKNGHYFIIKVSVYCQTNLKNYVLKNINKSKIKIS